MLERLSAAPKDTWQVNSNSGFEYCRSNFEALNTRLTNENPIIPNCVDHR